MVGNEVEMAIRSMTGYINSELLFSDGKLGIEIRSVNSRFLELNLKLSDSIKFLESPTREILQTKVTRGKVEVRFNYQSAKGSVHISKDKLKDLLILQNEILNQTNAAQLSVGQILNMDGILEEESLDQDEFLKNFVPAFQNTLDDFNVVRQREGEKLAKVLSNYCDELEAVIRSVQKKIPLIVEDLKGKLHDRLTDALGKEITFVTKEELNARIAQEITLYAMKVDVDEEIHRLYTHISEVRRLITGSAPVGKKLDFLMQEMNREANTLGSKSVAIESTDAAISMKVILEKMREQIQNIE